MNRSITLTEKDIERFWSKVDKKGKDDCWEWLAYKDKQMGYGRFGLKASNAFLAHRVAWVIHNKKHIPKGYEICHKCDKPSCVNPYHLFAGTSQENVDDKVKKGRSASMPGENNPSSRLTEKEVLYIKNKLKSGTKGSVLAKKFGVTDAMISLIKVGKKWSWLH